MNTLKLIIANLLIAASSVGLYFLAELAILPNVTISSALFAMLEIVGVVLVDAIIYLLFLGLTKENLVYSFIRRNKQEVQ